MLRAWQVLGGSAIRISWGRNSTAGMGGLPLAMAALSTATSGESGLAAAAAALRLQPSTGLPTNLYPDFAQQAQQQLPYSGYSNSKLSEHEAFGSSTGGQHLEVPGRYQQVGSSPEPLPCWVVCPMCVGPATLQLLQCFEWDSCRLLVDLEPYLGNQSSAMTS